MCPLPAAGIPWAEDEPVMSFPRTAEALGWSYYRVRFAADADENPLPNVRLGTRRRFVPTAALREWLGLPTTRPTPQQPDITPEKPPQPEDAQVRVGQRRDEPNPLGSIRIERP